MIPWHAAAVAVLFRVALARRYDGWLRLMSATALGLHTPALFFIYSGRYHHLAWLLTLLVCAVWARDEAWPWIARRWPRFARRFEDHPVWAHIAVRLDRLKPGRA
jgi:hypothetical protein